MRTALARLTGSEGLNFLLTNRLPRRLATELVGRLSKVAWPPVARPTMAIWRIFCDVDLSDAAETHFPSMRACFTRQLRPGARPIDHNAEVLVSPCDAIVGACGAIQDGDQVYQIKGAPYRLRELLGSTEAAARFAGGSFVTLRLTAGMYHHFHAPHDLAVETVTYLAGDCWNVNPPALKRVERLFCRNERAAVACRLGDGSPLTLVAVAAVLVSSLRFTFTELAVRASNPGVPVPLDATLAKGEDMGWFEQGSTIVVLLPRGWRVTAGTGERMRVGEALALSENV